MLQKVLDLNSVPKCSRVIMMSLLEDKEITIENLFEKMEDKFHKEAILNNINLMSNMGYIQSEDGIVTLIINKEEEKEMRSREEIYQLIIEAIKNGFKTSREMAELLDLRRDSVIPYLQKMREDNKIVMVAKSRCSRNTKYELFGTGFEDCINTVKNKRAYCKRDTPEIREKIRIAIKNGNETGAEIAHATKLEKRIVWRHLSDMREENLVKCEKVTGVRGNTLEYFLTEDIQKPKEPAESLPESLEEKIISILSEDTNGKTMKQILNRLYCDGVSLGNIFAEISSMISKKKIFKRKDVGMDYSYSLFKQEEKPSIPVPPITKTQELSNQEPKSPAEILFANDEFRKIVNQFVVNQSSKVIEEKAERIGNEKALKALINFGMTKEAAEKYLGM